LGWSEPIHQLAGEFNRYVFKFQVYQGFLAGVIPYPWFICSAVLEKHKVTEKA